MARLDRRLSWSAATLAEQTNGRAGISGARRAQDTRGVQRERAAVPSAERCNAILVVACAPVGGAEWSPQRSLNSHTRSDTTLRCLCVSTYLAMQRSPKK